MTAVIHTERRHEPPQAPRYLEYRRGAQRQAAVYSTPNYAARRAAAAVLAVMMLAAAVVAVTAVADLGGRPAVASDVAATSSGAPIVRVHVAEPGDTLWSIADRYRGELGRNRFVDALIDLNGGTVVQVGQAVRLP